MPAASNADDNAPASYPLMRVGFLSIDATTTTISEGADRLLGRLDALAESHGVLRRDCEVSLLMIREACTELGDSQDQIRKQSDEKPKQQRE